MNQSDQLIKLLRTDPNSKTIGNLISEVESNSKFDLKTDSHLLRGVWELRWSSSTQPWLKKGRWLENLQILDPLKGQGMNVLRARGPMNAIAAIAVEAKLTIEDSKRVNVKFIRGGWLGPSMNNKGRLKLLARINQTYPAWLDITTADEELRICRGNAGTLFCLLKRHDLDVKDWIKDKP